MINKKFLANVSKKIEADYGKAKRDEIIGNAESIGDNESDNRQWFEEFVKRLNADDIREYSKKLLECSCPCAHENIEENLRKNYDECSNLVDLADRLTNDGLFDDHIKIQDGALIVTKRYASEIGITRSYNDAHNTKCLCSMASIVNKPIPEVFCYCCTVGYYKKMFKNALGVDVKVEFISSLISGGDGCTAAIYVPEKRLEKNIK